MVTIFWLGSVELTLSLGGIRGVGCMARVRTDWNGLLSILVKLCGSVGDVGSLVFSLVSFSSMLSIYEYM